MPSALGYGPEEHADRRLAQLPTRAVRRQGAERSLAPGGGRGDCCGGAKGRSVMDARASTRLGLRSTTKIKFWAKIERGAPTACWSWTAGRLKRGYGRFRTPDGLMLAHRVAWELTHGPVPAGLCVLHRCDNPPCCNPAHLFLGTKTDNNADRTAKGRGGSASGDANGARTCPERVARGERHGLAKLTASAVRKIRARVRAGATQTETAALFGVTQSTISLVVLRRAWRHVPDKTKRRSA